MFYYTTVNTSQRVSSNVYLQAVLKMSAFCSDAGCQTTAPLINASVNNVLFQILPGGYQTLPKFISVLNPLSIYALSTTDQIE